MNQTNKKKALYYTVNYHIVKCSVYYISFLILATALVVFLAWYTRNNVIGSIGLITVYSSALFKNRLQNMFSDSVLLEFDNDYFKISNEFNSSDATITIPWDDVKSYSFNVNIYKVTYLKINLKNGEKKRFHFKDEKGENQVFVERSVISVFFYFITLYNSTKNDEEKIVCEQGFLLSVAGRILMYLIFTAAILDIIIHIYFSPNTSYISIILGFYFALIYVLERYHANRLYNMTLSSAPLEWAQIEKVSYE